MSYLREIPRDLFNEGNLLKCLGQLALKVEKLPSCALPDGPFRSFEISQDTSDGSLSVANLPLTINGTTYVLARPLNSRRPWPLYAIREDDEDFEPLAVFDDEGDLTPEFLGLAGDD